MAAVSNSNIYGLTIRESANDGSDFTNPSADYRRLFLGEDGALHLRDSAGAVTGIGNAQGTAMPGSPATNSRIFRTDLGMEFYYNGTRWLSTQLFSAASTGQHFTATAAYSGTTGTLVTYHIPAPYLNGGSDIWLVALETNYLVNGGTALGASHKWVATFDKKPTGDTNTNILTITVDSGSSNVWRRDTQTIGALMNNGTIHYDFRLSWTITGTPGEIRAFPILVYRIVAT